MHMKCDGGLVDVEGHRARARLSVFEANREPGRDEVGLIFGFYEDEYARLGEGWRFYRRRYTLQFCALVPASKIQAVAGFVPAVTFAPDAWRSAKDYRAI